MMRNLSDMRRRSAWVGGLVALVLVCLVTLPAAALAMDGMPGMSEAEMATMSPTPTPMTSAQGNGAAMPGMDMNTGGSINWLVISGFAVIVAGATLAAVLLKKKLRRRTLAGEFAGAGAQDV